jgi:hypothetical protein
MLIACGQDRFGALDQVQGLAGVAADRLALGFDGIQPRKEFRGGGSATNAASLGPGNERHAQPGVLVGVMV